MKKNGIFINRIAYLFTLWKFLISRYCIVLNFIVLTSGNRRSLVSLSARNTEFITYLHITGIQLPTKTIAYFSCICRGNVSPQSDAARHDPHPLRSWPHGARALVSALGGHSHVYDAWFHDRHRRAARQAPLGEGQCKAFQMDTFVLTSVMSSFVAEVVHAR